MPPHMKLRWILLAVLIAGGLWGWIHFSDIRILPIKSVVIQGDYDRIDKQAVQDILVSSLSESNFLTINTRQMQTQLLSVPWVASVSVSRVWPAKLVVHLVEHDVVARWNEKQVMSVDGKLFMVNNEQAYRHLPQLQGPEGQQLLVWEQYNKMQQALTSTGLKLTTLTLNARQAWNAQLSNGMILVLGRLDAVNKIRRAIQLYTNVIGSRSDEVDYVDLRYTNAVAVRWKPIRGILYDEKNI